MRLGQLARKLGTNPSDIIDFLTKMGLQPESSNARLDEKQLDLVFDKFGSLEPVTDEEPAVEPNSEDLPEEAIKDDSTQNTDLDEAQIDSEGASSDESRSALEEIMNLGGEVAPEVTLKEQPKEQSPEDSKLKTVDADDDVIRPQLMELPGLKVVGKIELPEPKPVEIEERPKEESKNEIPKKAAKYRGKKGPGSNRRIDSQINPIEAQRRRDAKQARRKKEFEARKLKDKRKRNYQKGVAKVPKKLASIPAPIIKEQAKQEHTPRAPKKRTILGKLWQWLAHADS